MSEIKEAVERLELVTAKAAHLIRWTEADAHDLAVVLSALQEAREALGPFASAASQFRPDDADTMRPETVQARHFRRAAEVYRSLG